MTQFMSVKDQLDYSMDNVLEETAQHGHAGTRTGEKWQELGTGWQQWRLDATWEVFMLQHLYADCSILLHILPLYCIKCLTCFYPDCPVQITTPVLIEIKQGRDDPKAGRGQDTKPESWCLVAGPPSPRGSQRRGPPTPTPVLPGERSLALLPASGVLER